MGGYTRFDSLAVAASGNICVATVESYSIAEISPDGTLLRQHAVHDMLVTNICFGGADLRTAYVTLSYSGQLAAYDWHEPGLRLAHTTDALLTDASDGAEGA
jgi:gluconolactonase